MIKYIKKIRNTIFWKILSKIFDWLLLLLKLEYQKELETLVAQAINYDILELTRKYQPKK